MANNAVKISIGLDGVPQVTGGLNQVNAAVNDMSSKTTSATGRMAGGMGEVETAAGRMAGGVAASNGRMAGSFSGVETAVKGTLAAFGAGIGIAAFVSQVRSAIEAIDSLKISTIQVAAQITTMQGTKDVAENYKAATLYADSLARKLQDVDANSFANYQTLLMMTQTMTMQGVVLDTNNKKQVDSFTALSNAVAMYTVGQNQSIQAHQEIRALMTAQVIPGSQLAKQIDEMAKSSGLYRDGLKEIVAEGKKHGDTLERMAPFLVGINAASGDIATTWTAVTSSMSTAFGILQRALFAEIFPEMVSSGAEFVVWLKSSEDNVTAWGKNFMRVLYTVSAEIIRAGQLLDKVGGTGTTAQMLLYGPGKALGVKSSTERFDRAAQNNLEFEARYNEKSRMLEELAIKMNKLDEVATKAGKAAVPKLPKSLAGDETAKAATAAKGSAYSRADDLLLKNIEAYEAAQIQAAKDVLEFQLDSNAVWAREQRQTAEDNLAFMLDSNAAWAREQLQAQEEAKKAAEALAIANQKAFDESAVGGMTNAIRIYGEEATNIGAQIEATFLNAFDNIEDALVGAFQGARIDIDSIVKAMAADLFRTFAAKPLTNQIAQLFNPGQSTKVGADGYISQSATPGAGALAGAAPYLAVAAVGYSIVDSFMKSDAARRKEHDEAIKMQKEINASILSTKQGLTGDVYASQMTDLLSKQEAMRNSTYETLDKSTVVNGSEVGAILTGRETENTRILLQMMGASGDIERLRETWDNLLEVQELERTQLLAKQETTNNNLRLTEMELLGLKGTAAYTKILAEVREGEMFGLDKTAQAIQRRIYALQDEQEAVETVSRAVSKTVDIALSAANAIKAIQGGTLSIDSPEQKYLKAQAAFAAATDKNAVELGQALLTASQGYNASGAGYQADYAAVMARLESLAGITGTTAADQQITLLQGIKDALTDGTTPFLKTLDTGGTITTITDAYNTMNVVALAPETKSTVFPVTTGAADSYSAYSGLDSALTQIKTLVHPVPQFAAGGDHYGGLRIVGERGPELEATGSSRIWSADQTRRMLNGSSDNKETIAELKEQNRLLRELLAESKAGNRIKQAIGTKLVEQGEEANQTGKALTNKVQLARAA